MSMTLEIRNKAGLLLCLALFALPSQVSASDNAARLNHAVSAAVGIGFEFSHGGYGTGADATLVTLPLSVFIYPADKWDITIEVPLLSLSSKSANGVIVTRTGGIGRGRVANASGAAAASSATVQEYGIGDISMTAGYTLFRDGERRPKVRPTFYVKIPSGDPDRGLGTDTVEAGAGLSVSKWFGNIQLFGEGAYILQNSGSSYTGQNYVSYLGGAGIQATDRLFVSMLAKGSSPRADGAAAQAEGRISLNFMHSRRISGEIYASAGFTDASPDYGGGLMVMYRF